VIKIIPSTSTAAVARLISPGRDRDRSVTKYVGTILSRVRRGGDDALARYVRRFDRIDPPLEIPRDEIVEQAAKVSPAIRSALRRAARNIRNVARRQRPAEWVLQTEAGVSVQQRVTPLDRVGCYVPGGRYPLPSSLLMTAIPAKAAGVHEVIVACPRPVPVVLAAAQIAGVDRVFRMGGAHAIAALAYGTRSVPRVDKIVGPGNQFVAAAKAIVSPDCSIDLYAGPTEIVVLSDRGNPDWIAADLIAQAEHDPQARAVLITTSGRLARRVKESVRKQLPKTGPAAASLSRFGGIIIARTRVEATALANRAAPEHLVCDDEETAARVSSAGAIFVGSYSAQVAGDYAIGSNHVLPTNGAARFRGGLNTADFVRVSTVQRLTADGFRRLAPTVIALAREEGLEAHARSIEVRLS